MIKKLKGAFSFYNEGCWAVDIGAFGFFRRVGVKVVRFVSATVSSFSEHRCGLHAAGLTYFSILAFVPVICMLMVCAKACGVGNFAREKINEHIDAFISQVETAQKNAASAAAAAPREADAAAQAVVDDKVKLENFKAEASKDLAQKVRQFANEMFDRIDKVDLSTLGWIGFAMLVWTVVSTLGQVEIAVNEVWHVDKARPIWRKFIVYLSIVIALPTFLSLAMSLPILRLAKKALDATLGASSYTRWVGDSLVTLLTSRLFGFFITLIFASLAFAVLLKMMPNRRVSFRASFRAGIITALLVGGWMKLCTAFGVGISRSSAMYGSFAAVPILLAWIYMSWQLVLLGSCMSYAFESVHRGSLVRADG